MNDEEIALCAAEVTGRSPLGASVLPLTGKQGLIVCRVRFADGATCIFKSVRESRKQEIALSTLLARLDQRAVPRVLGSDEDRARGLYWLVMEDVGCKRLADTASVSQYAAAAQLLARLQMCALEHINELSAAGLLLVDPARWEEIALRLLEDAQREPCLRGFVQHNDLEDVVWSTSALAQDASALPNTLIHGDLHANNIASNSSGEIRLLDWGSAYLGAAFLGLEELLWPAARYMRTEADLDHVRSAYLRTWAPYLGKPGHLERALLACRALVRMELLAECLRQTTIDPYSFAATFNKMVTAFRDWKRH